MNDQTRLLILARGLKNSISVYRLKTGWKLSFGCDPVLQTEDVRLFWNYPITDSTQPDHNRYDELKWRKSDKMFEGYNSITKEKTLHTAGVYHFYYTINGSAAKAECDGFGYFIVDPNLTVGADDLPLNMDAVQIQTVLPKLLGPFTEWKDRLLVSYKTGYNMIHFTPLQSLNKESNSSYSLKDQLELNPAFSTSDFQCTWTHISDLVKLMKEEWKMLSVTDMVYNHTAVDSDWLKDQPEAAYNLRNSPHLKPAYLLDRLVYYTSLKVAASQLTDQGIPAHFHNQQHLDSLRVYLRKEISLLNLHEFYTVDTERTVAALVTALHEVIVGIKRTVADHLSQLTVNSTATLMILQDPQFERNCSSVDVKDALLLYTQDLREVASKPEDAVIAGIVSDFEHRLTSLNEAKIMELQANVDSAVENILLGVKYRFVDDDGLKISEVTSSQPLVHSYFINKTKGYIPASIEIDTVNMEKVQTAIYIMAHNGWVMGDDPLKNFAEAGSQVYLRRELVVWGDSLKLRYGKGPDDSPYLWQRMEEYTKQTVQIFHGIRLDNCHSTPLHVAEHMMRYARSINPDLYVMAELFTSSEDTDNIFVNRLGLNSLIREGLSAWNASEQGRLVYRYGGRPVGSFVQPKVQLLKPTVAHALLMDATHDNESIVEKRTAHDSLALSAFVSMACCATGSNRGYDELIPHHINVVSETRLYTSWSEGKRSSFSGYSTVHSGINSAKHVLNSLHQLMGESGYSQVYVHDLSAEVVSITRHNPSDHTSFIGVARSAFSLDGDPHPHCDALTVEGRIEEVKLYGRVEGDVEEVSKFVKDDQYLTGLSSHVTNMRTNVPIQQISDLESDLEWKQSSPTTQTISFKNFPPGTVLIICVLPNTHLTDAQNEILKTVSDIHKSLSSKEDSASVRGIKDMMSELTLLDLNAVMYHCEAEESSINGYGSYNVPNYGELVYTGLQGILSPMAKIRTNNDLGHPICQNLRDGDWLIDYIISRMAKYKSLQQLTEFVSELLGHVKLLPRYLIPCYFDLVLVALSLLVNTAVWEKMGSFVSRGSPLVKELALCSQQFCGAVESAKLARLSPELEVSYKHPVTGSLELVTISAGLPHFSEGLMRIWGRDTFISLRGLLLVTERFSDARAIILSFAGTLRHGLIPNLHGEGIHARYNCRDAVWWWLQAIQDYCELTPDGRSILGDEVLRVYPADNSEPYGTDQLIQPLAEVMQEALQKHADGINFRERNAGRAIDEHMSDEGFNVEAGVDWSTGFVYGGNALNCGTWMDKMGSSDKAENRGKPATPRDGSAVELVGLCASTVKWLSTLSKRGLYPYEGVAARRPGWSHSQAVTFNVWYNLIKRKFESCFFVDGTYTSIEPDPHPELINKQNIYKDSVGASLEWADYQLRPNFPIAMVVAPDLFTTENAVAALNIAESHLMSPLGMKTLDKSDWTYSGDYINSDDSHNYTTARGFNYHNGPEWLWPVGYLMRAKLIMAEQMESQKAGTVAKTIRCIENKLATHHLAMLSTDWRSLPELTNSDGQICADSCPSQAWSVSCIMDVLYDISKLRTKLSL